MSGKFLRSEPFRRFSHFLLLFAVSSCLSVAQSLPDKGSVTGNIYTNNALGMTWEFPANWQVQKDSAKAPANAQTLLELLPSGGQSGESVAMICIDADHYKENFSPSLDNKVWLPIPKSNNLPNVYNLTLGNGLPVYRDDFKSAQEPARFLTFLSGPRKGYGVDFIVIANSTNSLEEIIHSLAGMKIQPDWTSNSQATADHRDSPDQTPGRVRISAKIASTFVRRRVYPEYPPDARLDRKQGTVKLLVHIGIDGTVKEIYVQSGPAIFVPNAIKAMSQTTYQPYLLQGKPVELETSISVIFEMSSL